MKYRILFIVVVVTGLLTAWILTDKTILNKITSQQTISPPRWSTFTPSDWQTYLETLARERPNEVITAVVSFSSPLSPSVIEDKLRLYINGGFLRRVDIYSDTPIGWPAKEPLPIALSTPVKIIESSYAPAYELERNDPENISIEFAAKLRSGNVPVYAVAVIAEVNQLADWWKMDTDVRQITPRNYVSKSLYPEAKLTQ